MSHMHPIHFYGTGVPRIFNDGSTCVSRLLYDTVTQQISQLRSGCSARHQRDSSLLWGCWTWITTLRSHFNAFSAATVTFCTTLLLCRFMASLVICLQRLMSLFWIIQRYCVFPASGIHPLLLFLPSLRFFFFFLRKQNKLRGWKS